MSITLELPKRMETELTARAARLGLPVQEYVQRVLVADKTSPTCLAKGSQLVSYWRKEGLIGTRKDIHSSLVHARKLRKQAGKRTLA